ncbi:MAG: phytoene synthase [Alphaproteobacteria bacterium]|nr:phytoene synthase [Alphaproteobacteria bacterium]HCO99981.1 squalene/phytoene synthase family protein [Rhodospirillaceae bacterium]
MSLTKSEAYCLNEVRQHDHDRYVTALFIPPDCRAAVLALYAFNLEIARTREIVSEPLLGQIRLQWWRESIESLYTGTPREHPVVLALQSAIHTHDLPSDHLNALIDAREADLEDTPPPDLGALEVYARSTSGELLALVMHCLANGNAMAAEAGRDVGTAWAIVGLARAVGFHAQTQRLYIPEDLLCEYEVERRKLFDLKSSPGLNRAIEAMVTRAENLLSDARARSGGIPKLARRGLILARMVDRHIAAIRKVGYDPFAIPPARPAPLLRLTLQTWRGRY